MLLTRMVNGLFNTNKNANQQQQKQQYQQPINKSSKANKKTDKSNNLSGNSNSNNNNNNNNNNSNNSNNSGNVTKSSTKVKSGSWKRSEKQVTSLNKKSKNSRKHSPAWLQFNNTGLKTVATTNTSGMTSICRPGTSYSDVLFAAGSSCLVKVKTLTPRRVTNATQKKLTIALLKCSRPDKEGSDNSAVEVMKERKHDKEHERDHVDLFPELPDSSLKKTKCTTSASPASRGGLNSANIRSTASKTTKKSHSDIVSSPRKKKKTSHKKNDILIVKNPNGGLLRNGSKLSLGNYLEQCINRNYSKGLDVPRSNKINGKKGATRKPFSIDIPTWNTIDVSGELYPKFLCQFDDEHYLRAETAALLGLKLALGNSVQQGKFKFFN